MLPVVALVGRPNVGKSTLFNRLTKTRDALVADLPGLTRDRQYGQAVFDGLPFVVIDTGGLSSFDVGIDALMAKQSLAGALEADVVFFLVDARAGLTPEDSFIAEQLRRIEKRVCLLVNKADGFDNNLILNEFYELGFADVYAISASHGRGIAKVLDENLSSFAKPVVEEDENSDSDSDAGIKLAVIGRPNVGKSTLINRLIGESRLVTMDFPGTTRDSISVPFCDQKGRNFTLIDTAGIRRRGKINETVEKFSVVKALQALQQANVCLMVVDATEGLTEQDLHLLGFAIDGGKAVILVVNKWDGLDETQKDSIKEALSRRLRFADYIPIMTISALHGTGVGHILNKVEKAYQSSTKRISTSELNQAFTEIVNKTPPPLGANKRRIKLRYAHMGGHNPPLIIIHGNQTKQLPESYKRYLAKAFRQIFSFEATPVHVQFKDSDNPYKDKKKTLTPRQIHKKKRAIKRFKK